MLYKSDSLIIIIITIIILLMCRQLLIYKCKSSHTYTQIVSWTGEISYGVAHLRLPIYSAFIDQMLSLPQNQQCQCAYVTTAEQHYVHL